MLGTKATLPGEHNYKYNNHTIVIHNLDRKINILPYLRDPSAFHGDPYIDQVIRFQDTFVPLIGTYEGQFGLWQYKSPRQGIIVLEEHFNEARSLMAQLNDLAQRFIQNPSLYDDCIFCQEYYNLTKQGYKLLRKYESHFGFSVVADYLLSLERAGLVSTRLALNSGKNALLSEEVRVVTKRTHLKDEPEEYLTVTIKWREENDIKKLARCDIQVCDFINPASGASLAAIVVAMASAESRPKRIQHRSISMTKQGVLFNRQALYKLGIDSLFYSVGLAEELNEFYYLVGHRAVGDAGHALRHFLPEWYHD
ncbi:hypothetical protein HGB07_04930 [Candidatus Roizmanbacteria bacterium]|nr:hypothetical protein [Candidatus Roizmanbacteria bacterium]